MTYVKRPINGISINGTEYLLNDVNEPMYFSNEQAAITYLLEKGLSQEEIDDDILFEEELQ